MSSTSGMVLRPGTRLGVYPQKPETELGWFDQMGTAVLNRASETLSFRKYRMADVVSKVNKAAVGLDLLGKKELRKRCRALRYELHRDNLKSEPVFKAFALTRENARRTLRKYHHDCQLFGGWVIVNGGMAEMATGEGKSFTATLAAIAAGLAGIPVHIITTNEYLVTRDAEELRPLYESMGLSVATVTETMATGAKRKAYASDIVYCTDKQIVFDYLRDRLVSRNESGRLAMKFGQANESEQLVLRGLCFAILDEADSVLIDEARTPLILSREHRDKGRQKIYEQALRLAGELRKPRDFSLYPRENRVELTERGKDRLAERTQDFTGIWSGARHRDFLVHQALSALHLFQKDYHYLVRDDGIEIIDKNTGRVMSDRAWQQGLQQMIECKEGCSMTGQRETLASIGYQRFFRRYLRLSGMSGTLDQVKGEMRAIYQQRVIRIPSHRPSKRTNFGCAMHRRVNDKWLAVCERIENIHRSGQPILVGTRSLHDSELLHHFLTRRKLPHRVLNARQDKQEADIIAKAGQRGQITIATNMAGRGTDIQLGPGVAELGGLHVLATECNEEYRIDRQLHGRNARQGDPGTSETVLSLHDGLVNNFYPEWVRRLLGRLNGSRPLPHWLSQLIIWIPQRVWAGRHRILRRDLLHMDEQLGKLLAYSGRQE